MQKYFDTVLGSDGSPLVGAQVTVYATGTTTKSTIYSDNGSTQAANPLTSDSRGMFAFYAADGRYDIKAEKSGFGTLTMSDIQVNEQDTAGTIAFTPTGGISANTVSGALVELDGEISTLDSGKEDAGTAAAAIVTHLEASNPHPEYLTPAEGDAAYSALSHAHNATAIVFTPAGDIAATTVAAALAELDTEKSGTGHAHAGTAITFTPTGDIAATTVSAALAELDTEKAALSGARFTGAVGYGTGAGGTVTQGAGSGKATAVTLDKASGQITTNNASLAAGAAISFQVLCASFATTDDNVICTVVDDFGAFYTSEAHSIWNGYFYIRLTNVSGGARAEAVRVNFSVIKGATS